MYFVYGLLFWWSAIAKMNFTHDVDNYNVSHVCILAARSKQRITDTNISKGIANNKLFTISFLPNNF